MSLKFKKDEAPTLLQEFNSSVGTKGYKDKHNFLGWQWVALTEVTLASVLWCYEQGSRSETPLGDERTDWG